MVELIAIHSSSFQIYALMASACMLLPLLAAFILVVGGAQSAAQQQQQQAGQYVAVEHPGMSNDLCPCFDMRTMRISFIVDLPTPSYTYGVMLAGATTAASDLGIALDFAGTAEYDPEQQAALIQSALTSTPATAKTALRGRIVALPET